MSLREHDSKIKDTFDLQEKFSNMVNLITKILASFDEKVFLLIFRLILLHKLFSKKFFPTNRQDFRA